MHIIIRNTQIYKYKSTSSHIFPAKMHPFSVAPMGSEYLETVLDCAPASRVSSWAPKRASWERGVPGKWCPSWPFATITWPVCPPDVLVMTSIHFFKLGTLKLWSLLRWWHSWMMSTPVLRNPTGERPKISKQHGVQPSPNSARATAAQPGRLCPNDAALNKR